MFCVQCGSTVDGAAGTCTACGHVRQPSLTTSDVSRAIRSASTDAWTALKQVARDPIGGLATSFEALGEQRGRAAGIAFGAAFALLMVASFVLGARKLPMSLDLKVLLSAFFTGIVPFATIALSSGGARHVFNGSGTVGADLFTAGVAMQPFGALFILAALLGGPNFVIVAILTVFAATYSMCVLFVGCTRLSKVPERFAPPAVALMLLVALWLSKIMIASFFGWMNPLASLFN